MPVNSTECKPVLESYICDECGTGHMNNTGNVRYIDPLQYEHRCSNHLEYKCANIWLSVLYPRIIFTDAQK